MAATFKTAIRSLFRSPGVSAVVIADLAIGIALVTGMVTLLNGYTWAKLPYPEADRIIAIGVRESYDILLPNGKTFHRADYGAMSPLPSPLVNDVRRMSSMFTNVASYDTREQSLRIGGSSVLARTMRADVDLLPLLRATPMMGRAYSAQDGDAVAVISYNAWRRFFALDPRIIGRTVYTEGTARTVIGVMPKTFGFENADVLVPLHAASNEDEYTIARLVPAVSKATARARIEALQIPPGSDYNARSKVRISEDMAQRDPISHAGSILLMFVVATVFVLIIACANVVSILLARGVTRRSQYAIRGALGASRLQVSLESLAESAILAIIATALGVVLASWGIRLFVARLGANFPSWLHFPIDSHLALAAGVIALFVMMSVGWMPALQASRSGPISLLNSGTVTRGIGESRIGRMVVIVAIALSAALFIGTMLLLRSFSAARGIKVGYDDARVAVADVRLDATRFHNMSDVDAFLARADRSIGTADFRDHAFVGEFSGFRVASGDTVLSHALIPALMVGGQTHRPDDVNVVSDNFFSMLGIKTAMGRAFNGTDTRTSQLVAVVSQSLAKVLWPGQVAVGQTLQIDTANATTVTIVGVMKDRSRPRQSRDGMRLESKSEIYFPTRQTATRNITFMAKQNGETLPTRALVDALDRADPSVAVWGKAELLHDRNMFIATELTIIASMFGGIASVALLLAMIGLFGIIAYSAQQRTREIGIRMALGAAPKRGAFDVMEDALRIVLVGLGFAFVLSMVMGLGLRGFMYGITTTDPITYVFVTVTFAGVALLAAWLPSRRAMRISPMNALRPE